MQLVRALFLSPPERILITGIALFCGAILASKDAYALPVHYQIGIENQLYDTNVTPQDFPWISGTARINSKDDDLGNISSSENEYLGDLGFRISPTHYRAFDVHSRNLYWGEPDQSFDSPLRFTFGRRLIGWSKVDELWSLGQVEPIDAWDRLRPFSQGLTGVFGYTETQKFNFRIFLSGIFLPETNPNVVIENNQFVNEHPQSISSVPQTYPVLNRPTPLGYQLDIPSIAKIIFRPSFAFSMETKREIPFLGKFMYGYLPLNYFPIALEASYGINIQTVVVNLKPRLLQHHIYNGELAYRLNDSIQFGTVALVDQPVADVIPANYTTTPLTSSVSWSPWIRYEIAQSQLQIAHLWVFGGLDPDVGPNSDPNSSIFSSRILYRNATQVALKTRLGKSATHPTLLDFKYIHEYSIKGDWIAADIHYSMKTGVTLLVGGDIISSYRDVSPDRGAEFLADVRPLGRFRLGVTYAL
jgi:hypothetical protein